MVSGVWNQLLFLGNRIDGLVRAGESGAALSSAHLALNLLQHSCRDEGPGLATPEAERLRELISDRQTQVDALRRLVDLARGVGNETQSLLPPLWRSEASSDESQTRKLTWAWRESLGTAVFRMLRYQHTRFSPTGQAGAFLFRADFDPASGLIHSVKLPHLYPSTPVVKVSEEEAHAFFIYNRDVKRFYLGGLQPERLVVDGTERRAEGERPTFPDFPELGKNIREVLEALHGSEALLPRFKRTRQMRDGAVVHDLDPMLFESNARYALKVLPSPDDATMGMTMRWNESMTRAVRSGDPEQLSRLFPVPDIYVSVAENGAFAGFVYQMPDENSPRGTVYEIGSPELGVQARLQYGVYRSDGIPRENVRVPTGVRWVSKPNRLQKTAIDRWIRREEFRTIRDSWTLTNRSV